ncbi:shikimate dehydrogenase family protein [Planktosalinus lacus]|uniref:Shikimate 5-dehydrogenase n=1 Tax=Planktosalinus lacus TaxID=1526573 RepID=A0A8J2V980_9FLAO|nr:shikimate dehydrogenase [Planktosalinus lacus]GGD90888.1 shikimate 5-dehydrogenase [Planktosalinus lacus]
MATYGLLGKNISYSFSKPYFESFFQSKNLHHQYLNFDISKIEEITTVLKSHPDLKGLNVTIPYKEQILSFLYKTDKEAKRIGAVNTVKISKKGNLIGYNSDHYGFAKSLSEHFPLTDKTALILGSGGASKAIAYVLNNLNFKYTFVSREKNKTNFSYNELTTEIIANHKLIINCTPLGTSPNINGYPNIPYKGISDKHLLFDLIYNPKLTIFLKLGKDQGARIVNGEAMLKYQAMKSWEIWNS